jgi:nicotinamide-nucleotide amidase
MRCDVVAVGTELLLGQIIDTNSSWIGRRLAASGVDSLLQIKVGDNQSRIVSALSDALSAADAVICCGGLGPTQDDITRESIAELMGVPLERDLDMVASIRAMFETRKRVMPESNQRQADKPKGSEFIINHRGTAPGLICPIGDKVLYAVPGVPHEMMAMVEEVIVPDLVRRSGATAVIASRVLRTWGAAESAIAEMVAPRLDALNLPGAPPATIAFLASGMEGIKVRVTAKAADEAAVHAVLDSEERELRAILGDLVFGIDDDSMERVIARALSDGHLTLAVAESLTGGLVASRLVGVAGASNWFRGGVVAYASDVKFRLLGVPEGPVVSGEAAMAMAVGVRDRLRADIGLGVTGVAGPDLQEGKPVGTVFVGLALPNRSPEFVELHVPGDRERVRRYLRLS